jgi:hypothetical protein
VGKNLINSLKFLFALIFQSVNLSWDGCMANFEVPIQAPFGLVCK